MNDRARLEAIYLSHGDLVLRRAKNVLKNDADAREVLQEVFMSLLDKPEQLKCVHNITGWLYTATTHRCLNIIRGRRLALRLSVQVAQMPPADDWTKPERVASVHQALAQLEPEVAQACVYHFFDGLGHDEIAQLLGCSPRKVRYLLANLATDGGQA